MPQTEVQKHRIVLVAFTGEKPTRVVLEDGSELVGLDRIEVSDPGRFGTRFHIEGLIEGERGGGSHG